MSWLFTSGGQSIGSSASVSVLPVTGLISFKIDWFDLLVVKGILKSLLKHKSSKASIFQCSIFFMVTVYICHSFSSKQKVSLIFWLQSPSAVILEPKKIKSVTASISPPSICYEVMGLNARILRSRDHSANKGPHMVFPVVMYGCEKWTMKKGWVPKNWWFWTVMLEKILECPWTAKEIKPVNPKWN